MMRRAIEVALPRFRKAFASLRPGALEADISAAFGGPASIGELFLTDHLLAFEITSIVLLVAAVGGVILGSEARKRAAAR